MHKEVATLSAMVTVESHDDKVLKVGFRGAYDLTLLNVEHVQGEYGRPVVNLTFEVHSANGQSHPGSYLIEDEQIRQLQEAAQKLNKPTTALLQEALALWLDQGEKT